MPRRKVALGLVPIVEAAAASLDDDPAAERLLDIAAGLMGRYGLRRWNMEDVADGANVGRTTVYRLFGSREGLVHSVLARELRETIASIHGASIAKRRMEDGIIEGALVGLAALRGSLVEKLLREDPTTILPFLTTEAGPLVALTRQLLSTQLLAAGAKIEPEFAAELAEVAARLGLSFILTRGTTFPVEDDDALRTSLRRLLRPVLAPLFQSQARARRVTTG